LTNGGLGKAKFVACYLLAKEDHKLIKMTTVHDLDAQSRCLEFVLGQSRNRQWPTHLGLDSPADHPG
jgi:hypothetical protein